jgi:hypothetical protein
LIARPIASTFGRSMPRPLGRDPRPLASAEKSRRMAMLLDVRTYTCRPGTIKKHLAVYEEYGKEPQTRHLGQPFAYLVTETGNPNQYLHIWLYQDAGDRERKRAALWADPDWVAYTEKSAELGALVSQQNRLMTPVKFFEFKP